MLGRRDHVERGLQLHTLSGTDLDPGSDPGVPDCLQLSGTPQDRQGDPGTFALIRRHKSPRSDLPLPHSISIDPSLQYSMYFRPSSGISSSLLSILLIPAANSSLAQCSNSASYGGGTAPSVGNTLTMTTCQWSGEYATVTGVAAGATFQSTSSIATDHITVRRGVPGGTLVAFGTQPLSWTAPVAGTY